MSNKIFKYHQIVLNPLHRKQKYRILTERQVPLICIKGFVLEGTLLKNCTD